jgi:hypothetical protein
MHRSNTYYYKTFQDPNNEGHLIQSLPVCGGKKNSMGVLPICMISNTSAKNSDNWILPLPHKKVQKSLSAHT